MPQKTDAVIAELMDRRLLNDVDPDLHQEIAKAVVKAVHTASLQGEDAVERVKALAHRFWSIHPSTIAAMNLTREEFYAREMMALLATGLVPDEAAIRPDNTANLISIIADIREKTGLGGKPMLNELADAIAAEIDRRVADEREKCAKVAEGMPQLLPMSPKHVRGLKGSDVAAAIRSGDVE